MICNEFKKLRYEVKLADKRIALFLEKNDAISFAKTKKEDYSWVEVIDTNNNKRIYYWIY